MTTNNNNKGLFYIIILLLISLIISVIVIGLKIIDKNNITSGIKVETLTTKQDDKKNDNIEPLVITIISDKRCINCNTDKLISDLKKAPFLNGSNFKLYDFQEEGIANMLKEKGIKNLPAVLVNQGKVDKTFDPFLTKIDDKTFSLNVGGKFDPFVDRSKKGFRILDKSILQQIKETSHIKGNKDAKITWLEFSDLECPFCAKLHNSDTEKDLISKYGNNLNMIFQHFPLDFHKDAEPAAKALECIYNQKGNDLYYLTIKESYKKFNNNNFNLEEFYTLVKGLNSSIDIEKIKQCVKDNETSDIVKKNIEEGKNKFNITGTPGNVIINNETGEYEILSGAYPTSEFIKLIDKLIK